jgi:hypothetical protein
VHPTEVGEATYIQRYERELLAAIGSVISGTGEAFHLSPRAGRIFVWLVIVVALVVVAALIYTLF